MHQGFFVFFFLNLCYVKTIHNECLTTIMTFTHCFCGSRLWERLASVVVAQELFRKEDLKSIFRTWLAPALGSFEHLGLLGHIPIFMEFRHVVTLDGNFRIAELLTCQFRAPTMFVSRESQMETIIAFCELASQFMQHHFHCTLLVQAIAKFS